MIPRRVRAVRSVRRISRGASPNRVAVPRQCGDQCPASPGTCVYVAVWAGSRGHHNHATRTHRLVPMVLTSQGARLGVCGCARRRDRATAEGVYAAHARAHTHARSLAHTNLRVCSRSTAVQRATCGTLQRTVLQRVVCCNVLQRVVCCSVLQRVVRCNVLQRVARRCAVLHWTTAAGAPGPVRDHVAVPVGGRRPRLPLRMGRHRPHNVTNRNNTALSFLA
jgi:hypothetical protein